MTTMMKRTRASGSAVPGRALSVLSPRAFGKLVTARRLEGADAPFRGRPWELSLEDRVLLVFAASGRTDLTLRRLALLFGASKLTADRGIDHLGPLLALQPRRCFAKGAVLIVDGTLVPTRHTITESPRTTGTPPTTGTRLAVVVGRPLPGNRNDCKAWEEFGPRPPLARPRRSPTAAIRAPDS